MDDLPTIPEGEGPFGATWDVGRYGKFPPEYRARAGLICKCGAAGTICVRLGNNAGDYCDECWMREGKASVVAFHREVTVPALKSGPTWRL